jgi:hypothetical protein
MRNFAKHIKALTKRTGDSIFSNIVSGFFLMLLGLILAQNDEVKAVVHELITPDLIRYSREFQQKAADEIASGKCPTLNEFMKDYLVMRDQTRFVRGEEIPE